MAINSDDKRAMLEEFMVKQNSKCLYCGVTCFMGTVQQRVNKDKFPNIATIEHLLPLGMPDRNRKINLAMCCNKCNNKRSKIQPTIK